MGICNNLADGLAFLYSQAGIEAECVNNMGDECETGAGAHTWVIAKLDGNYYYIDPTWGIHEDEDYVIDIKGIEVLMKLKQYINEVLDSNDPSLLVTMLSHFACKEPNLSNMGYINPVNGFNPLYSVGTTKKKLLN